MTVEDQLVEVGRLLGGEAVQAQVVQDQQVGSQEGAKVRSRELSTRAWFITLK